MLFTGRMKQEPFWLPMKAPKFGLVIHALAEQRGSLNFSHVRLTKMLLSWYMIFGVGNSKMPVSLIIYSLHLEMHLRPIVIFSKRKKRLLPTRIVGEKNEINLKIFKGHFPYNESGMLINANYSILLKHFPLDLNLRNTISAR